jgi:nucleoside diphosphate kinase
MEQQWDYVKTKTAATSPSAAALRTIRDAYGARVRDRLDQASAAGSDTGAAR